MTAPILIVDDDPVQRRLLEGAVTKFGHEAIVADGGEAALKALDGPRGGDVAAVILDLAMPGIDGLGVLKAMQERGIALPVIVQTAQGGIETVVSAMRAGAFDFVVKPASPERLRAGDRQCAQGRSDGRRGAPLAPPGREHAHLSRYRHARARDGARRAARAEGRRLQASRSSSKANWASARN